MSLISFLKETRAEMKHVRWPTIKESFAYTVILIALCLILAALLGFFDYLFGLLVQLILLK